MISLVVFIKRKEGISKQEFRDYYENHHVPLAKKHLGHLYVDYLRHYIDTGILVDGKTHDLNPMKESDYDCITTIQFEDDKAVEEFVRISSMPDVRDALAEDERHFQSQLTPLHLYFCDPVRTWTAKDCVVGN